jgi:hypothetical protein
VGDGPPALAGQGDAPAAAGLPAQEGGEVAGVGRVERAVSGGIARGVGQAEPGREGHGQVHRVGQPRSARRGGAGSGLARLDGGGGGTARTSRPQGSEGLAGEQRQIDLRAELVHGAAHSGPFQRAGQGRKTVIGGQHVGGGQVPAGQRGGAGVLLPPLHPGVALGALLALAGGRRVGGQRGPAGGGAQLPARLARGRPEHVAFDGGGVPIAEPTDLVGDDRGLAAVDAAGGQCGHRGGQPPQRHGQVEQGVGRPAGQRQRGRDLVGDVLPGSTVPARGGLGDAPRREVGHGGQLQCRRPRRQPPGGLQHADELVVAQTVQPHGPHIAGQAGQRGTGRQVIGRPAGGEPAAASRLPGQAPGHDRLGLGRGLRRGQILVQ